MQTTAANILVLLAALMLQPYESAQAKGVGDQGDQFSLNINMSGTIVANGSCTFNQGGTINVDFGDVRYQPTADGNILEEEYKKVLASDMTCTGDSEGSATMLLSSSNQQVVQYNGHTLLSTSVNGTTSSDLAIALEVNGAIQDVNSAFTVDMQSPPALVAELMLVGGGKSLVNNADVTASATLIMAFN